MTTVQIIGIAVASAVVVLLVIALLVTRRRGDDGQATAPTPEGSFLDDAPQDTLSRLGQAEQPVEDVTVDPAVSRAQEADAAADEAPAPRVEDGGLALDWGPSGSDDVHSGRVTTAGAPAPTDAATSGEMPAAATTEAEPLPIIITESGAHAAAPVPARPAEGGPAADEEAAPESGAGGSLVPLSDIIVTTSSKMVDLQDPEVRRMLTDLVKFEIDQATQFRTEGQTIDAILQLTEAEKISRALGMQESAQAIREMMEGVREQT
ncbi:MAG TPA: hypothetical protein VIL79_05745 [Thermoleophilia bacterium]